MCDVLREMLMGLGGRAVKVDQRIQLILSVNRSSQGEGIFNRNNRRFVLLGFGKGTESGSMHTGSYFYSFYDAKYLGHGFGPLL